MSTFRFIWQDNGQIVANSKCVTVRKDDSILTVADCMHGDDNSQLFVYQKTNKMVRLMFIILWLLIVQYC